MPTPHLRLTSRQHPVVRAFRDLAGARRGRDLVLLDGAHLIGEAFTNRVRVETVIVGARFAADAGNAGRSLLGRLERAGATIYDASDLVIDAASPVRTSSGVVAIAHWAPADLAAVFAPPPALVIGLVGVQDPGNLGAAIRSADALGATGVIAIDDAADPGGWKALRGAMGSTFRLPVARAPLGDVLAAAAGARVQVLAAATRGGRDLADAALGKATLVLLGSEGAGLPNDALPTSATPLTVPMREGVESLNVAVTAALILYEARRQRAAAPAKAR